ncbi:MAG: hypothetical protein ACHQ6U_12480, partial [Thermodesulfobacteriota bacterium]
MKFNLAIIKLGLIVTIIILAIGLPSWLFTTVTAADFPKTGINTTLVTISFGYFIILMLCAGLAAFWGALLIISFGIQIQRSKIKIIY